MREIKFRGLGIFDNQWTYGGISNMLPDSTAIIEKNYKHGEPPSAHVVDPKTVGEYTGFKDIQGNEVFEGDVLSICFDEHDEDREHGWNAEVIFHHGCFMAGDEDLVVNIIESALVIGNIHEHPHLLEGTP